MDIKHETPKDAMGGHLPPAPHAPIPPGEIAHERTDIDPKSVTRIATVLAIGTVVAAGIAFGLFQLLANRSERNDPPPPPLSRPAGTALAPEPRLQTAPVQDLAAIRAEDRRALGEYGWADEARGVARIPIEEAMALYAAQAARPGPASPAPAPSASPRGGRR
jgi:hypothetical protein